MNEHLDVAMCGGSGGLGGALYEYFEKDSLWRNKTWLSSKYMDVKNEKVVEKKINECNPDVLIYAAARNYDATIHKTGTFEVDEQIRVNAQGFVNVLKYAIPLMRKKEYGRIIFFSSILSKKPIRGAGIYSATKAFCDNLIKTAALENGKYNITVNSIQLGYFNKGLIESVDKKIVENVIIHTPMGRLGQIEDLYSCIKYITNSSFLTGANINLDGGYGI